MFARQDPSLSSRKLKPPLESRRVRTQPCSAACRPMADDCLASSTESLSIRYPPSLEGRGRGGGICYSLRASNDQHATRVDNPSPNPSLRGRGISESMTLMPEPPLDVDRRHAAGAGGGHRLAIVVV